MEKDDEKCEKDPAQSGNTSGSSDYGNHKDLQTRLSNESDSVQVLQLTDSFFVADTVEDDDSMMIPPTPDMIIPSTQEFTCDEKNGSVLSVNETFTEDMSKESKPSHDVVTLDDDGDDIMNDMTQDIPELDETQQLLPKIKQPPQKTTESDPEEDDDWQLKFSETQETQELLSTSRNREMREAQEQEKALVSPRDSSEKKEDSLLDHHKQTPSKLEENDHIVNKSADSTFEKDNESEDEIEPSQSCLLDYQKSSTYNAFRDEHFQNSLNYKCPSSTPDSVQTNVKISKPSSDGDSDVLLISDSPKKKDLKLTQLYTECKDDKSKEHTIEIISEDLNSEQKTKIDSDIVEVTASGKVVDELPLSKIDTWVVGDKGLKEKSKTLITVDSEVQRNLLTSNNVDPKDAAVSDLCNSKEATFSNIGDTKDVTISDLKDPKVVTVSDISDPNDVTISDLGDPKDVTVSDLGDAKDITESDLGDSKDITISELDDPKDVMVLDMGSAKDVTPSNNEDLKTTTVVGEPVSTIASGIKKTVYVTPSDDSKSKRAKKLNFECASDVEDPVHASTPYDDKEGTTPYQSKDADGKQKETGNNKPTTSPTKVVEQISTSSKSEVEDVNSSSDLRYTEEAVPLFTKPILQQKMRLSRKQKVQFQEDKKPTQICLPFERKEKQMKMIGSFKDMKTLEKVFKPYVALERQYSQTMLNMKSTEEFKFVKILSFFVKDGKVYLEESIQRDYPDSSPSSSGSLITTSISGTLHSGEIADISGSSSAKSVNSSEIQLDTTSQSMPFLSQETPQKTSTQNAEQQTTNFAEFFVKKKEELKEDKEAKTSLSPIKSTRKQKKPATSRKRTLKSSDTSTASTSSGRRKRGKYAKEEPPTGDTSTTERECLTTDDIKPRKGMRGRRKNDGKGPTKQPPPKQEIQEIEVPENEDDDSPLGTIFPGDRVMARWSDGFYYPGLVQSLETEGRWLIRFDDGNFKTINQEGLIKVSVMQAGTSILVQNNDNYFDPGIICGHFREGNKVGYEVELDSGITKRYPRTSVILSTDQAKLIINSRPPKTPGTCTINLDNLVHDKRKRKSLQSPDQVPPAKKSSRIARRTAKVDSHVDTSAESNVEPAESAKSPDKEEQEGSKTDKRPTRQRKAAVTANKKAKFLSQRKNPQIFKDYAFLLTNAERKPVPKPDSESESFTEEETIVPYDKEELVILIVSRGGKVIDKYDDIKKCTKPNIYLLANIYLRTMKYIQCLAAAIPCIKHHWVKDCCSTGEIQNVKNYILPAGTSLITNEIIEWHGKTDVLKGMKISLVSAPGNTFVDSWTPVLLAAKADFVQKSLPFSKSGACAYVDLIITNSVCPQDIIQSAKRRKIPIVSIEWMIQSLIAGRCLSYDAHPKFKHDFTG